MRNLKHSLFGLTITLIFTSVIFAGAFAQTPALNLQILNIDSNQFPVVRAYLTASDAQGFPITGIAPSAFDISEDDHPVETITVSAIKNTEQPLSFVLVMDTSGSMAGTPLTNAVAAAKNFTSTLLPNDQVAIISCADTATILLQPTSDHALIETALDGLTAKGNTVINDSIIEAVTVLKNHSERKAVILLTDGNDTGSKFSFDQTVAEAQRWSVPVYPIGFGNVDKDALEKFAILTGGFVQVAPDSTTLTGAFTTVLDNLREQYLLVYTSALPADGMAHTLEVSVDHQSGTDSASMDFNARPNQVIINLPAFVDVQEISGLVEFKAEIVAPTPPITRMEVTINQIPAATITASPFVFTWDSASMPFTEYLFEFSAYDSAGNRGYTSLKLITVHPIKIVPDLQAGQSVRGDFLLSATVTSAAEITKVEFLADGVLIGETITQPFQVMWNTRQAKRGLNTVTVRATDGAGYTNQVDTQVNVEIANFLWVFLFVIALVAAILIPLALRRNKKSRSAGPGAGSQLTTRTATLTELSGIHPGQIWQLAGKDVFLGRKANENDIQLKGAGASRRQAVIQCRADGFYLASLKVENPMLVNNRPAGLETLLRNGDILQADESRFRFESQA